MCYKVYAAKKRGWSISYTIKFYPHDIPMLKTSTKDKILQEASEFKQVIKTILPTLFNKVVDTQI